MLINWRRLQDRGVEGGRTCQHSRATVGVLQLRWNVPCRPSPDILTRKRKSKVRTKGPGAGGVPRSCSESVRRSGAVRQHYFCTRANGSDSVSSFSFPPPAFRFRSHLRCPSPFPPKFRCRYPITSPTMSYIRIGLSFQVRRHMRGSVIACVGRDRAV